ncbi:hypothetical protein HU200_041811 [Digitaria exilis]|uniref:Uncharacterized protein n=1 Tax=Digitaria exilis TaxID=1010633 RepID=A0A835EFA7_9POAL|nr:hypothetical protein HU200_041811 [Digitaria exilis]
MVPIQTKLTIKDLPLSILQLKKNNPRFAASDGVPPEVVIVGGLTGRCRRSSDEENSTTARSSAFRVTMGFDVGEDNIVTASLEDLSPEDHERYIALQKHIEAEFLKTFRKGHLITTQYVQTEHGYCNWTAGTAGQTATGGQTAATGGQTACSGGQPNLTNAMVFVPEQPLPLFAVPNSASAGRAGSTPGAGVLQAVRPAVLGGQTACPHGRPKMLIPKHPEVGTWKMNVAKEQGVQKTKVTFDMLYDKYTKQKAVPSDRPPPVTSGQTARQGQLPRVPPKQVYRPKKKEEVQSMDKRKLQRLRFREKQEQELEKQRDEVFNQVKPMIPQKKEWKPKEDRQAVQPAVQAVQTACQETASQAVRPPVQAVKPGGAEALGISSSGSSIGDGKPTSVPTAEDDEELVDYSSSPERMNLDVNVLHMSMDGDMLSEEENNPRFAASDGVPPEVVIVGGLT